MLLIKTGLHDSTKSGCFKSKGMAGYTTLIYGLKGMQYKMLTRMLPQNKIKDL